MKAFISIITVLSLIACSSPTQKDENMTPKKSIHEAAFFGDLPSIEQHIAAGTDLNQKDEYGSTPLNIAITFNKEEVAIALIKGGSDLSVTTADGSTPLISAAFFGRTAIVQELIHNKADITATNSFGATALATVSTSFEEVKPIYDQISKDLGPLGFKLDYHSLQTERKAIAELLNQ